MLKRRRKKDRSWEMLKNLILDKRRNEELPEQPSPAPVNIRVAPHGSIPTPKINLSLQNT